MIQSDDVILFQGDSITDAGRARDGKAANEIAALGHGYAYLAAARLLARHPEKNLQIYNRGVSGNQVPHLEGRWDADCLALEPTLVSILIGVNDSWRIHDTGPDAGVDHDRYETGLRALVEKTRAGLEDVRIVLAEPFVLRCGAVTDDWFPEFDERREIVHRLAGELDTTFVPFQTMFDDAVSGVAPAWWAADGVHPTAAGHALMAERWLEVVDS